MSQEEHKRVEGARTKVATTGQVDQGKVGGEWKFTKSPVFLAERLAVWNELIEKQDKVYAGKSKNTRN